MHDLHSETSFGDLLHRLVRRRGWSMADFAERLGVNPSTVSRIRTGKRRPRSAELERWAAVLELDSDERRLFHELALVAQAPAALRERLATAEARIADERARRATVENQYAEYRREQNFYDGIWLSYHRSFLNDDTVVRSLAHITGDSVAWLVMEAGTVQYSYTGSIQVLGDKMYVLLEEDRGNAEHVQVTCHALFEFRRPTFLYGIVTGISGATVRNPVSYPSAARLVMLYAGSDQDLRRDPDRMQRLRDSLGSYDAGDIGAWYMDYLGGDDLLRRSLRLKARDDMDAVLMRMIDNHLKPGEQVLQAAF